MDDKPKALKRGWLCNVSNCNGGTCCHKWTGVPCPWCGYEMIMNTKNDYIFCSYPCTTDCDYGGYLKDFKFTLNPRTGGLSVLSDINGVFPRGG